MKMSKNTEWLSMCLIFVFSCLRLENKTLECCLTHLNSLTQKHMLQNTKAAQRQPDPFLQVQLVTCCHRPVATKATARASICCTAGSSGSCRSWPSIRLHYHRASPREEGKLLQQQLRQRRAALNSLSQMFHIKHLYSVSWTPSFYSASKTCNCDVCVKPGV